MIQLVVIHDFADFKRGDHITDPAAVEQYRDSANVVAVSAPEPEPAQG